RIYREQVAAAICRRGFPVQSRAHPFPDKGQFCMVATLLAVFSYFSKEMAAQRERTFIMVKPDGVQRGIVGEIIKRFENRGYKLVACKMMQASRDHLQKHYAELKGKPFFDGLCAFMSSGPVVAMVWEGKDVVKMGRKMLGETNPLASDPGTIRGDFCIDLGRNICHGSDSVETANREIDLWFNPAELMNYTPCTDPYFSNEMAAPKERSFIMVKPDGVQRGIVGEILKRFETRGYKLVACKMIQPSRQLSEEHYGELKGQPFFEGLVTFTSSGPVVAMVWEGKDVVRMGRKMLGATNPLESEPGTIRGDFCIDLGRNVCHGSDSVATAEKEIKLWFPNPAELISYTPCTEKYIYE
ncbi:hypothetical protein KUTeg_024206, partial [Tegillarca granosa]